MFSASPSRLFVTGAIHENPSRNRLPNWQYRFSMPLSSTSFPARAARAISNRLQRPGRENRLQRGFTTSEYDAPQNDRQPVALISDMSAYSCNT